MDSSYNLTIYQHPLPDNIYAIGGDPAEGLERGDDSVLEGVCCNSGEQIFELYGKIEPVSFGELAYMMGVYYNDALIGIENNRDNTSNRVLRDLGYKNIYLEHTETNRSYRKPTDKMGWNTNLRTRPQLIALGRQYMSDGSAIPRSIKLINQFKNFALHMGVFRGLPGSHDDFVMAWLICMEMMRFQLMIMEAKKSSLKPLLNGEEVNEAYLSDWAEEKMQSYHERLIASTQKRDREPDNLTGMGSYV